MNTTSKRTFDELPADGQQIVVWIHKDPYGGVFSEEDSAVEFADSHFIDVERLLEMNAKWITKEEGDANMRQILDRKP